MAEDEMLGQHHWLNRHELGQTWVTVRDREACGCRLWSRKSWTYNLATEQRRLPYQRFWFKWSRVRPGIDIYLLNVPQVSSELVFPRWFYKVWVPLGLCSCIFLLCSVMLVVEMFSVCEFHFCYSPDSFGSLTRLKRKSKQKRESITEKKNWQRNLKEKGSERKHWVTPNLLQNLLSTEPKLLQKFINLSWFLCILQVWESSDPLGDPFKAKSIREQIGITC